jgi:hypothetical protein
VAIRDGGSCMVLFGRCGVLAHGSHGNRLIRVIRVLSKPCLLAPSPCAQGSRSSHKMHSIFDKLETPTETRQFIGSLQTDLLSRRKHAFQWLSSS